MLSPARGLARATAVAAVLIVTTAGCGDDPSADADAESSSSSTPTKTSVSSSPSASTSRTPTSASPTPTTPKGGGGPLLSADELPGFTAGYRWQVGSTTSQEPRSFGTCQRFGILAIGAESVVVRQFRPADSSVPGATAGELVATFPDTMTARRAYSVLESWQKQCMGRLKRFARPQVGGLRSVAVDGGQASWYLLTYAPKNAPDHMLLDAQGMALVGRRIAMLEITRRATEGDPLPPMDAAVEAAAARLR